MGAIHSTDSDAPRDAAPTRAETSPTPTRVLLVEDERLLRISLKYELESLGYRVECAADGNDAARIIETRLEPIDLLLTDIVVPGPTGPQIAELARAKWPATQVLFMSAYPRELLLQQGRIEAGQLTLEKPFTEEQLALKMREALREV